MIRVHIRGWKRDRQVIDEFVTFTTDEGVQAACERHMAILLPDPHSIEIEFLDEPDPSQRFLRIGTDPRRMVQPIEIHLGKEPS